MLDILQIQSILPHRYPFLLIDRVIEVETGKRAVGLKNVSINEEYFQGHFPGQPVMPGVLQIEAMAQLAGALLLKDIGDEGKLPFLMAVDGVKFRKAVVPGDQLILEAETVRVRDKSGEVKTKAFVDGKLVAEAQIRFMLVDRTQKQTEKKAENNIQPTAKIHPDAKLADNVVVGAYVVIGPNISIGKGTRIHDHVIVVGNVNMGENNDVFPYAVLGEVPQDVKFNGTETTVEIGDQNTIREFVTVHRGTHKASGKTIIGNNNYIMAYCHIAHDCELGNHIIMANGVQLGGHVKVEDYANFGGLAAVHHFTTIGRFAFIGGLTRIVRDAPPFMTVEGNPAKPRCINTIGCKRAGLPSTVITALKNAHKVVYRSKVPLREALKTLSKSDGNVEEVKYLINFLKKTGSGKQGRAREAMRRENA
ncbi:MAG: acyl-ACP--UDP-N-acetylglucosamine O-acyltransferase [Planctomycetota bacterium]